MANLPTATCNELPYVSNEPNGTTLKIDPEIRKISSWLKEPPEIVAAQKRQIEANILSNTDPSARPTVHYWDKDGAILDGILFYEVAESLGLVPEKDYPIRAVSCESLDAALRWRWEQNILVRKHVPTHIRCFQVIELYRDELARLHQRVRQNRINALKGQKTPPNEKIDRMHFLAEKARVSVATMKRMYRHYRETLRNPNDPNPKKRPVLEASDLERMLDALDNHEKSIKQVSEDIKNEHERKTKGDKNSGSAPEASPDFRCDTDFNPSKPSQIICNDSLALLRRWVALPKDQRPSIHVIFGSPPYWIPRAKSSMGKGRIVYGERVQAFLEQLGIKTFEDYVEKFLRPYIECAYELLPEGGALVIQVDNTRGRDERKNLMVFWHTDAIRRIGQSLGFIPCPEIVWKKDEIAGRRQGFGSPKMRAVRPNHEYVIVMRKNRKTIEGDFGYDDGSCYKYSVTCWDEEALSDMTAIERATYLPEIWDIGTARANPHAAFPHPATFPVPLAYGVVKLFVPKGGVILDPWNGIGNTSAAALLGGRRFIGIDIEPYFCEEATKKVERTIRELPKLKEKMQAQFKRRLKEELNIDTDMPPVR